MSPRKDPASQQQQPGPVGPVLFLNPAVIPDITTQSSRQYCHSLACFPISAFFWVQVGGKCLVLLPGLGWWNLRNLLKPSQ